jgi:predicted RNA-binding protein YlxR (DUF448 family)
MPKPTLAQHGASHSAKGGRRPKHTPQRTCVVCRSERGKRELVRIVRAPAGEVQVDLTGKVAGRGAYLCKARLCWENPALTQKLNAALKTTLTLEELAVLRDFIAKLPVEEREA